MSFGLGFGFPRRGVAPLSPAVAFNFASGSQTLDPRITFSRTTNATLFGSDGSLQYAPHNLLTYSEQLDNAVWIKAQSTITSNDVAAPDGTFTADKIVETVSIANEHNALQQTASSAGALFTLSFYAKKAERDYAVISFGSGFTGTPTRAWFDLTNGTVGTLVNSPTASIVSVGNGWYRCSISKTATVSGTSGNCLINVATGDNVLSYPGDGISGIYVWGAQLNVGALQPYYSTTVKNTLGYTQEFDNAAWSKTACSVASNLLTYSEQFDNAAWTKTNSTISPNLVVAPDGTTSADKVVEDTTLATHFTSQSYSNSNVLLTFSIYIRAAERSIVRLQLSNNSTGAAAAFFDASNGTISSAASNGGDFTGSSATVTSVGNGWYRCSLTTFKGAVNTTAWPYVTLVSTGTTTSYTGDGTSGIYIWGAQLNVGATVLPYQRTEATARAVTYTAPDGSTTADKLIPDISTGPHYTTQSPALSLVVGQVFTYSVYAKAAELTFLQLILTGIGPAASNLTAGFDLTTGVAGTPSAGSTSSIVAIGNGWYRCAITTPIATAGFPTQQIRPAQNSSSTPSSYTGDGTSGIYIWGAQVSDSASLDAYKYNPGAAPTNTAYYGPRFDYDPVTLAARGLLIEESRTNQHLYSEDLTQWGTPVASSVTANTAIAPDGFTTADKLVEDTTLGTHFLSATAITYSYTSGTSYTRSCFLKAAGRFIVSVYLPAAAFPANNRQALFDLNTGTVYSVESGVTATIQAVGNGWYRCAITAVANATGSAHVGGSALIDNSGNGTYTGDGVSGALIWGAQMEAAVFATSYIPTTTTALTRAADVASMTGANFSNWYNAVEGTFVVRADTVKTSGTTPIVTAQVAGGADRHQVGMFTPTTATVVSGVTQALIGTNASQVAGIAYSYKTDSFAACSNGGTVSLDASGLVPSGLTYATLGKFDFGGGESLNGHIRSFSYYRVRLSDATLQALTAP